MASARPAFLYVVSDGSGAHKVGISIAPARRLKSLQSGSPRLLKIVRESPSPVDKAGPVEAYVHWLLREAQSRGEWFKVPEQAAWDALNSAAEAVARGEKPPWRVAGVGRPRLSPTHRTVITQVRLTSAMKDRIEMIAGPNRLAEFIREAVEAELKRRERKKPDGKG